MKNKSTYFWLLVIFAAICAFNIYWTFERLGIDAMLNEMPADKRSAWLANNNEEYTTAVDRSLALGLDLQGGMYVTLEIAVDDILRSLSSVDPRKDTAFEKALQNARTASFTEDDPYVLLFVRELRQLKPNAKLSSYFHSKDAGLSFNDPDDKYIDYLTEKVDAAIENTLIVLRERIDQFGVASPNIQSQGNGRIAVELPGVKDSKRVGRLLRQTAKLEFWETYPTWQIYGTTVVRLENKAGELVNRMYREKKYPAVLEKYFTGKGLKADVGDPTLDAANPTAGEGVSFIDIDEANTTPAFTTGNDSDSTRANIAAAASDSDSTDAATSSNPKITEFLKNPLRQLLRPIDQQQYIQNTSVIGYATPADTAAVNYFLRLPEMQRIIPERMKFLWASKAVEANEQGAQTQQYTGAFALHAIKTPNSGEAKLDGQVIVNSNSGPDPQTKEIKVNLTMNAEGAKIWAKMTEDAAPDPKHTAPGAPEPTGLQVAIALDNRVVSSPVVNGKIPGGRTEISGNFTLQEAKDLSNILQAGKLPTKLRVEGEQIVGPTLGAETVEKGLISFIFGFLAVILFMAFYYKRVGLIADVALLINLFFVVGVMSALNITLTLPGIAGIVLSMGMAVDANVLIYERVREELLLGKSIKGAIAAGFRNANSAIVDGNITTFLTGVILFSFGSGPIQGFAVTLMIGIVTTLITALLVTRMLLEWLADRPGANNLTFGKNPVTALFDNINRSFINTRKLAYGLALVILVGAGALFATQGFKMSVDFEGGRQYTVAFQEVPSVDEVRKKLTEKFDGNEPVVREVGAEKQLMITTNYRISEEDAAKADADVQQALLAGLAGYPLAPQPTGEAVNVNGKTMNSPIVSSTKVGPTIARDIKEGAILAVIFALVVIFFYVFARFQAWQFGLGALFSLAFNVTLVLGVFAFLGGLELPFSAEVNQAFIAAVLTIVGYTINDTVVVFDRIRERLREDRSGKGVDELFNKAINETLSRTIVTSITTLLTAFILFFFGGDALKGFMLALILGIAVGTFSSIFLASPLAMDLLRGRKPVGRAVEAPTAG